MPHIQAMELRGTSDVGDPVHMAGLRAVWMAAIDADLQAWAKGWNVHRLSSKKKERADPRFVTGVPAKLLRSKPWVVHMCVCAPSQPPHPTYRTHRTAPTAPLRAHLNPLRPPHSLRHLTPPPRAGSGKMRSRRGSTCSCSKGCMCAARPLRESIP